jgi:hypothetical protein
MSNREDETWLNINPHPRACNCSECVTKRKRITYPYPAEIVCPSCGNISMYYSEQKSLYRCVHDKCLVEGKTIKEIADKKANQAKILNNIFEQLNKNTN